MPLISTEPYPVKEYDIFVPMIVVRNVETL
jgi:hypothetical protein